MNKDHIGPNKQIVMTLAVEFPEALRLDHDDIADYLKRILTAWNQNGEVKAVTWEKRENSSS